MPSLEDWKNSKKCFKPLPLLLTGKDSSRRRQITKMVVPRAVREGLLEIANQDADVALCDQTALDGVLMLDRMEDEDARQCG